LNQNWCETFFDGLALDLWRAAVQPETTRQEAGYLLNQLQPRPGARLLDVPCGNGRHAIEVASHGFQVTGVDLSPGFHNEAKNKSGTVRWILGDMRRLDFQAEFDGAWCWGNSFGYFPHDQSAAFLAAIARALKPGALFVLETGALIDSRLPNFEAQRAFQVGDIAFQSASAYHPLDARLDIVYTFERGADREVKPSSLWLYGAAELLRTFRSAGFHPVLAAAGLDGEPYGHGSQHMIVTARRLP
jgi:SAM-dependent methyltransferase